MSLSEQEQVEELYMIYRAAKKTFVSSQKIIDGIDKLEPGYAERYEKEKENE